MTGTSNDNGVATTHSPPDAFGQAAMLLTESLLHGLITKKLITTAEALEIVTIATEVKEEVGPSLGDDPGVLAESLVLLEAIGSSLRGDLVGDR